MCAERREGEGEGESEPACMNVCMFSLTLWWVVWISRAHIQTATHTVNNKGTRPSQVDERHVPSLCRLSHVQDVSRGHQLLTVVLKFLSSCLKLKVNRQYAIQPHLNTLNTLLAVLNRVRTHVVPCWHALMV